MKQLNVMKSLRFSAGELFLQCIGNSNSRGSRHICFLTRTQIWRPGGNISFSMNVTYFLR